MRTDDSAIRRGATVTLAFDVPVAPGVLLTDPERELDLITAKLYAYFGLSSSDGWRTDAAVTAMDVNNLIHFIRWRLDRGIGRTADLTLDWFEEYCHTLKTRGFLGLVPAEPRMEQFLAEVASGTRQLPFCIKGRKRFLDVSAVLRAIGFAYSRQTSLKARAALRDAAASQELGVRSLAENLAPEAKGELDSERPMLSANRMGPLLAVWERLYALRERMVHDPLGFDPFEAGGSPNQLAQSLGAPLPGRTPTLPPEHACFLIDRALRWVLVYSDDLKALYQSIHAAYAASDNLDRGTRVNAAIKLAIGSFRPQSLSIDALGAPWPIAPRITVLRKSERTPLPEGTPLHAIFVELLPAAAAIVIATFSARRRSEVESLRQGCIIRGEDGEPWLLTWIGKSNKNTDLVPIPEVVAKAVAILEWLDANRIVSSTSQWLFDVPRILSEAPRIKFDLARKMPEFASFIGLPPGPNGESWDLAPHQLRRFFAITYYYRYKYPSLTALSDFLRHHDPDVTRRYVTERAGGGLMRMAEERRVLAKSRAESVAIKHRRAAFDDFEEVRCEFMVERFKAVANGAESMGGFGGERLKAELQDLVREARLLVEVKSSAGSDIGHTLDQLLVDFVKGKRLEPHGLGHSYCKCTSQEVDLAAAACLVAKREAGRDTSGDTGPDAAFAVDMTCSSCPHNVQMPENRPYWEEQVATNRALASAAPTEQLRLLACQRAAASEQHIQRCFITAGLLDRTSGSCVADAS